MKRLPYLLLGLGLFAAKIGCDTLVSRIFNHPYSVLFYLSPMDSPLFTPGGQLGYWFALWGVALPFIAVGLTLTARRLDDAGLPRAMSALFFVPFANLLFFGIVALLPTGTMRRVALAPGPDRGFGTAVAIAGALGAMVALGAVAISVGVLRQYGAALMIGAPSVSGFASALVYGRLRPISYGGAIVSCLVANAICIVALIASAREGLGCLVMAIPLEAMTAICGAAVGAYVMKIAPLSRNVAMPLMAALPLTFLAEHFSPLPMPEPTPIESVIEVNAPPDVVWKRVIAFPALPAPTEFLFRAGIAAPLSATISGEGPGAVRRCHFDTGDFVEPIEVWNPGRELRFSVSSQPDPMREATLYDGPRPPHLDGYLASTQGQFLLEPLPGGRTRLIGRTWYRTNMVPERYWRMWANPILHRIHLRVLEHVAALAEQDQRSL